ncbi:hypothetical protein D3C76_1691340 [compost metagenome]
MAARKEIGMGEDAERIYAYLTSRSGGGMPYSDATPPDLIKQRFGISKAAFKRALGKLMKEGKVEQKENWTYLVQPADEAVNKKMDTDQDEK